MRARAHRAVIGTYIRYQWHDTFTRSDARIQRASERIVFRNPDRDCLRVGTEPRTSAAAMRGAPAESAGRLVTETLNAARPTRGPHEPARVIDVKSARRIDQSSVE